MDLELVLTEDLMHELLRRFDNAVFIGHIYPTEEEGDFSHHYQGDPVLLVGLLHSSAHEIMTSELNDRRSQ